MIRSSRLCISNNANQNKIDLLEFITEEMLRVVNLYIDILWEQQDFKSKYIKDKIEDTWLSARMQQCLGKQALEIVKSQRKRKKKTKPIFKRKSFTLDSRFIDFKEGYHFDKWIRFKSIGNKLQLNLFGSSNIAVSDVKESFKVGDSIVIKNKKYDSTLPLASGSLVMLTGGRYMGHSAVVKEIKDHVLFIELDGKVVETLTKYAYVIGKNKPIIKVVE